MADTKISQLTSATTPLAGTEVLPIVQSSTTKKVATDDLTVKNVRSNATTGILQIAGPAASATRTMTTPDANFTVARSDAAQTLTGTQTVRAAATQDGVALAGRAGGTSSYTATITPTTLTASRTVTLPNADTIVPVFSQTITFSGPTAARTVTLPDSNTIVPITSYQLTFTGPSAARTITFPDANFTAARTDAANSFTGDQTLATGNLVIGTSGKGIDFSADGQASGMTSELLNDYEEGLHTPTLTPGTSGTITLKTASDTLSYVKVGNLVTVNGTIDVNSVSSPVGYLDVSLPFTAANLSETSNSTPGKLYVITATSGAVNGFTAWTVEGTATMRVFLISGTGVATTSANQMQATTVLYISITYRTA